MSDASIYGCRGPARAAPLTRADLPPHVRAAIRELHRLEPRRNVRLLVLAGLWAGAAWAVLSSDMFLVRAAGTLVIAGALTGMSVLMHEGCHGLLFRSRASNHLVGLLCGAPALISPTAYRTLHLLHHAHERTPRDPDDIESLAPGGRHLALVYYLLLVAGTYLYLPHVAVRGFLAARGRKRLYVSAEYAAILAGIGAAWLLAPDATFQVWGVPLLVAAQFTSLRGISDHGLTSAGNPFTATRTVLTNPVVAFFLCNLNYHLEHHLYPGVPWYNLPRLHRLLAPYYPRVGASVYPSYTAFILDFVRVSRSGLVPNARLLPSLVLRQICG